MLAILIKALHRTIDVLKVVFIGKPEPKKKKPVIVFLPKNTDVPPVNKYAAELACIEENLNKLNKYSKKPL